MNTHPNERTPARTQAEEEARRMRRYPVIDQRATGRNICQRRTELGYTVLEVQRYLNLACPQSVYHWQAGRTLPSVDNFYALSVLLNTTVNDLIAERAVP